MSEKLLCDSCEGPLSVDSSGYYVGADDTSDCPDSEIGHSVLGCVAARGSCWLRI